MRDRPWIRPGALAYGLRRVRAAIRPPVTVVAAPSSLVKRHDVPVRMRDGVTLRVNVYAPDGPGPFPVLLSAHPYGKDALPQRRGRRWHLNFQFHIMYQSEPFEISSETGWEAPDPVRWTQQGFAVVNADLRGSGTSDGVGSMMTDAEAEDIYDLIEWAGTQPWSTGVVGMLGVSYLAMSQYKAAALKPPHLRAICPWEGFTDLYRDFMMPGGVEEDGFSRIWATATSRHSRLSRNLQHERSNHPLRDDWWHGMTPNLSEITVPMLVCGSFSDANLHSTGSMRAFRDAASREKHLYTHRGPKWATFYSDEAFATQLRFFDRHLRNADTPPLPRVRLEIRETRHTIAEVREELEWPLARTDWRAFRLSADGTLIDAERADSGSATFSARGAGTAFEWQFDEDTEITGPMSARLWMSIDGADDATVFVGVEKRANRKWVPFEGSYGYGRDRVAIGRQRVSLRLLDETASTSGWPVHAFTAASPVTAGQIVPVDIALSHSATLFYRGDSLRLVVAGRNLDRINPVAGHFPAHYRAQHRAKITLHWSDLHPSHVTLPLVHPAYAPAQPSQAR